MLRRRRLVEVKKEEEKKKKLKFDKRKRWKGKMMGKGLLKRE